MNYVGCCLVVSGCKSAKAFRMDSCHCILVRTSCVLSRPPTAAQQSADRTKRARQSSAAPPKGASLSAVCTSSVSTLAPGSTLQQTAHAAPQQIPCAAFISGTLPAYSLHLQNASAPVRTALQGKHISPGRAKAPQHGQSQHCSGKNKAPRAGRRQPPRARPAPCAAPAAARAAPGPARARGGREPAPRRALSSRSPWG